MKPLHEKPFFKRRLSESLVAYASHFEKMEFNFHPSEPIYGHLKHAFLNQRHKWDFMIGVAQTDGDKRWFNWERITCQEHYLISEIQNAISERLEALHDSLNPKFVAGQCWVGMPCGISFTEEHMADYMTKGGIFNART